MINHPSGTRSETPKLDCRKCSKIQHPYRDHYTNIYTQLIRYTALTAVCRIIGVYECKTQHWTFIFQCEIEIFLSCVPFWLDASVKGSYIHQTLPFSALSIWYFGALVLAPWTSSMTRYQHFWTRINFHSDHSLENLKICFT